MTDTHKHVVCFAPYTDWSIHSARRVTILHALRQRGASVSYVTCDGVFSDYDLFQKATGATKPRDAVKPPGYGPVVSRVSGTGGLMFRA